VTTGENSVSAELAFVVNYTDNDATYKCEVTHPALTVPLMKMQKLKVLCKRRRTFTKIILYCNMLLLAQT